MAPSVAAPQLSHAELVELLGLLNGSRTLELSTKCAPAQAFDVAAQGRALLTKHGVALDGEQQTKTRRALEFFSQVGQS
jgi:hypothetical protein